MRTDPVVAGAVVNVSEAIRFAGSDNRSANLLRLGLVIDALSRHCADESVAVYAVGERGVLSDTDLTSNERMALRRWSDDGLIEIIPAGTDPVARVCEIAWVLGLPVITGRPLSGFPGLRLIPAPTSGSLMLVTAGSPAAAGRSPAFARNWRCSVPGCPSFPMASPQPPAMVTQSGAVVCPRHMERVVDTGPKPPVVPIAMRLDGLARYRFALTGGAPLIVGRAPDGPGAVVLGPYLTERVAPRVSRSHLRLELRDGGVVITDLSTNGSLLNARAERGARPRIEKLAKGQPVMLGEWDVVELAEGVEIGRADRSHGGQAGQQASSVMQDAPTVAIRLPRMQ